jgi:hypothetical protein
MMGQVLQALGQGAEAAQAYQEGMVAATRAGDEHARGELAQALEALRAQGT